MFINEDMSEADQEKIGYKKLDNPRAKRSLSSNPSWTIDRENDTFLLYLDGGMRREDYHVPYYFIFCINKNCFNIIAEREEKNSNDMKLENIYWNIISIENIVSNNFDKDEYMLKMIKNAFIAYGRSGFPRSSHINVDSVFVSFSI